MERVRRGRMKILIVATLQNDPIIFATGNQMLLPICFFSGKNFF
jgi:hypothetical protein